MSGTLETDIAEWRARVTGGTALAPADADELESHLRQEVAVLAAAGLSDDEAFLIAVKRLGAIDQLTGEFAREHGERLWKQLGLGDADRPAGRHGSAIPMVVLAVAAAVLVQVARLAAGLPENAAPWFVRNLGLFFLVPLVGYFAWRRTVHVRSALVLAAVLAVLAVAVNLYPFGSGSDTQVLVAVHLPVVLWLLVGAAYLAPDLRSSSGRMDFIRFSGEWFIYYVLIALGGGVLIGLTNLVLLPIAPEAIDDVVMWALPSGAAAAVVVAAWLVEAKKGVIENIAPVLTVIFTPLFAIMLIASAIVYGLNGVGREFDRDLLIVFDVLLLVVIALVLYGLSARDPLRRAGVADALRLAAVVAALILDLLVLGSMLARIGEFGFTPNRVAALGLNLLLVGNLAGTAWLSARMIAGRSNALRLERWQTAYLPFVGLWAALVTIALPPLFAFA
ncbi:permease prefix domain 1-containing protein [Lysobacter korlensis]|uniref:Permease prefix domain 1-containing protein n=1 Tax=Lysobacter korlensis TaxID=553636 RepID=A0ABV6RZ27_9GAMM